MTPPLDEKAIAAFLAAPVGDTASACTSSPSYVLPTGVVDISLLATERQHGLEIRLILCYNGNTITHELTLYCGNDRPQAYAFQLATPIHRSSTYHVAPGASARIAGK